MTNSHILELYYCFVGNFTPDLTIIINISKELNVSGILEKRCLSRLPEAMYS